MGVECRQSAFIGPGGYLGPRSENWPTGFWIDVEGIQRGPTWESWMGDPPDGRYFMQLYQVDKAANTDIIFSTRNGNDDDGYAIGVRLATEFSKTYINLGIPEWPEGVTPPITWSYGLYFISWDANPLNQTNVLSNKKDPYNDAFCRGQVTAYTADAFVGQPPGWWDSELVPIPRIPGWKATKRRSDVFREKNQFFDKKSNSRFSLCLE